jgi:hypothetical protein
MFLRLEFQSFEIRKFDALGVQISGILDPGKASKADPGANSVPGKERVTPGSPP